MTKIKEHSWPAILYCISPSSAQICGSKETQLYSQTEDGFRLVWGYHRLALALGSCSCSRRGYVVIIDPKWRKGHIGYSRNSLNLLCWTWVRTEPVSRTSLKIKWRDRERICVLTHIKKMIRLLHNSFYLLTLFYVKQQIFRQI